MLCRILLTVGLVSIVGAQNFRPLTAEERCNGQVRLYTAEKGWFQSPNYGVLPYPDNDICYYRIITDPGRRVRLSFRSLDINTGNAECGLSDYLAIYNSDREDDTQLVGVLCGKGNAQPITSAGNKVFLKFSSDQDQKAGLGFYVAYETFVDAAPVPRERPQPQLERIGPKCAGKVTVKTAPYDIISSPNYGLGPYFPEDSCYWQIIAIPGKLIRLSLVSMNLEETRGCFNDYVNVYDGATEAAPLLQAYCGDKMFPGEILSSGTSMFVKFAVNEADQREGFRFTYQFVDGPKMPTTPAPRTTTPEPSDKCKGRHWVQTSRNGYIASPHFGYGEYYNNDLCYWQILSMDGHRIKLTFNTFEMEDGFGCPKDQLAIFDGPNENSKLIGSFCGSNKPATIESTGKAMYLKFTTDTHAQYIGFKLFYEFIEEVKKDRCDGAFYTLNEMNGVIISPNYGKGEYPEDDICHWQISSPEDTRIRLKVESLVLEDSVDCTKDYLSVWDGPGDTADELKTWCGSAAQQQLLSSGTYLYLRFKSSEENNYPGFKVHYEVVEAPPRDKCNGKTSVLHGPAGYFNSPNFAKGPYYSNDLCFWDIRAPAGKKIRLVFEKFDLEDSTECANRDHVSVYDGPNEASPHIGDYCGALLPKTIVSQDNLMYVKFMSDATTRNGGFRIFYEFFETVAPQPVQPPTPERCHGKQFLLSGVYGSFQSPNFGRGEYFSDDQCFWLITLDVYSTVKLSFGSFDVESDQLCSRDRVIVYDGNSERSPVIGTFCGYKPPPQLQSTGPNMLIKFETDSSAQRTGFRVSYDSVYSMTQPRLMLVQQPIIQPSPMNLAQLPNDQPKRPISPYPGASPYGPLFAQAGRYQPAPRQVQQGQRQQQSAQRPQSDPRAGRQQSNQQQAYNPYTSYRPAPVDSRPQTGRCSGTRLARRAMTAGPLPLCTSSPNYGRSSYANDDHCEWVITSPTPGSRVKLSFSDFDLENRGPRCDTDYVQVLDGSNEIGRFCGHNVPPQIKSTGNTLTVVFRSDSSIALRGFKMCYEITGAPTADIKPFVLDGAQPSNNAYAPRFFDEKQT